MKKLSKSEFMKMYINDYYAKRYEKRKGEIDSRSVIMNDMDKGLSAGSCGKRRLKSW